MLLTRAILFLASAFLAMPALAEPINLACDGEAWIVHMTEEGEMKNATVTLDEFSVSIQRPNRVEMKLFGKFFSGVYAITHDGETILKFSGQAGEYGSLERRRGQIDRTTGLLKMYWEDSSTPAKPIAVVTAYCEKREQLF